MKGLTFKLVILAVLVLVVPVAALSNIQALSRVYITAIPCSDGSTQDQVLVRPQVTLSDQALLVNPEYRAIKPQVAVTESTSRFIRFYFDVQPGFYEAFLKFPEASATIGQNGPLIVLPGKDRHLDVTSCNGTKDWHDRAVIAGLLPTGSVAISVLVFDHAMKCGDDFHEVYEQPSPPGFRVQTKTVLIDNGAYYATFRGYAKDQAVALLFSGALDDWGAVLIRNMPATPSQRPPFIRKDLTAAIIGAALSNDDKLVCVDGF